MKKVDNIEDKIVAILATIDLDDDRTIQAALEALVKLFDQTDDLKQQEEINQNIKEVFMQIEYSIGEAPEEDRVFTVQKWKHLWADLCLYLHGVDIKIVDVLAEAVRFNPAEEIEEAVRRALEHKITKAQRVLDALGRYGYKGYAKDHLADVFSDMPTMAAEAIDEVVSNYKDYDFLANVEVEGLSDGYIERKRRRRE